VLEKEDTSILGERRGSVEVVVDRGGSREGMAIVVDRERESSRHTLSWKYLSR